MDRENGKSREAGEMFVNSLYQTVISTGEKSLQALEELSGIAMGGHELARKLINDIDDKVSTGELVLPKTDKSDNLQERKPVSKTSQQLKNILFITTHPTLALRAKARQLTVAIEHEAPPHTSTWEEFPRLPLADAAKAIRAAEENLGGGVPKNAWSATDRERMARGERPLGHPEHPNI